MEIRITQGHCLKYACLWGNLEQHKQRRRLLLCTSVVRRQGSASVWYSGLTFSKGFRAHQCLTAIAWGVLPGQRKYFGREKLETVPTFGKGVNCFAGFCFHKLLRKQANMRHHPRPLSLKVSLYSKEYLPDLFTNANEAWWLHIWQSHLQTGFCDDSVCLCDQHLFHYHNIHLAFAHRSASIFNLFILHSIDIYVLPTMS